MSFDLDQHLASLDAEMDNVMALALRPDRQLQKVKTASELMGPLLFALNFLSKQSVHTPGLDYLVGIRGRTVEIRAERPGLLSVLRFELDAASTFQIEERRFGRLATQSSLRTATSEDAVQECIEFVAHHIARMRPELARDARSPGASKSTPEAPQEMFPGKSPNEPKPAKEVRAASRVPRRFVAT